MSATPSPARCDTCRWFDPDFVPIEHVDDPADASGLCMFPKARLPLSEQGIPSERRPVNPAEINCPTHEAKAVDK